MATTETVTGNGSEKAKRTRTRPYLARLISVREAVDAMRERVSGKECEDMALPADLRKALDGCFAHLNKRIQDETKSK